MYNQPLPSAGPYQDLVVQFLADLMSATTNVPIRHAFQHAAQAFCYALQPWRDPADGPACPRGVFRSWKTARLTRRQVYLGALFPRRGGALSGLGAPLRRAAPCLRCPVLLTHLSNNAARERVHVVWYRPCCFLPSTHSQPVSQLAFLPVVFRSVGPTLFPLPK